MLHAHRFAACAALASISVVPAVFAADALDTVTITASPIGDGDSLATLVESVDRDAVLATGAASLGDALLRVPGVNSSGFAPGASRPIIRGYDSSRVRVLENGLGSFDVADVGPDHGVPVDPLGAERIEILRGPGTLRFGSQAIGGVVNTLNQRVPTRLPTKAAGELSASGSTAADARDVAGHVGGGLGRWALHADAFRRRMEDYESPAGAEAGTSWDGQGGSLGASRIFGRGFAGAALVHHGADYGLPGEDAYIHMRQDKVLLRAGLDAQGDVLERLTLDAGRGDYRHAEVGPDGEELAVFENEEWESRIEATFGAVGPLTAAALGAQFQQRDYAALGEAADYLLPTTSRSAALFAFGEAALTPRLRLQFGARVESARVDGVTAEDLSNQARFTPVSISGGAVFDIARDLQLGLTLASSGRAPAQTELYARGPHEGTNTFERGDAELGIERANAIEATLHWRREGAHLEAALWAARHEDFIHGSFTGRSCDEEGECAPGGEGELRELVYRAADARFHGVELEWEQRLGAVAGGELSARLTGDAVRARFVRGGDVPRIPAWRTGVGLEWNTARWRVAADLRRTGRQSAPGEFDTQTPAYTSVDASVSWQAPALAGLQLTLVGRNLTDSEQRNAASFNKDTLLLPGRDLRLLARLQF